jgi:methylated-DNA-[protein]-cysteine S-methyltransferase
MLVRSELETPVGKLFLVEKDGAVVALGFEKQEPELTRRLRVRFGETPREGKARALAAVRRYIEGDLGALDDVVIDAEGTDFQKRVWAQLRKIRPGQTKSYGDIARALGDPQAVRAVGAANGRNPISIIVPCHRVIRSDGSLCGYAGGLEKKRWLLEHEGRCV